jgi:hypothetical protein
MVIVRGSRLPCRSGKGDTSGIEVLSVSLCAWLKIKTCLYKGARESLESTSTWIRGDWQITETKEKNWCLSLFSSRLLAIACDY